MNSFSKTVDFICAFICMFMVPVLFFETEVSGLIKKSAENDGNQFLELTANSCSLSLEAFEKLMLAEAYGENTRICELELSRNEYTDTGEKIRVNYSAEEISMLLKKYGSLPLREGDYVKLCVYLENSKDESRRLIFEKGRVM